MKSCLVLTLSILGLTDCSAPPAAPVIARPATEMPFCTRTLGQAECFADPSALNDRPQALADVPVRLVQPVPWWQILFPH